MGATVFRIGGNGPAESNPGTPDLGAESNPSTRNDGGIGRGHRGINRLVNAECLSAKPREKVYTLTDGDGMFLLVKPNGSKLWQIGYRFAGKEKTYSIGPYPDVTLEAARVERAKVRAWLREGKDPTVQKHLDRATVAAMQGTTFRVVADEWLPRQDYTERHRKTQKAKLETFLYPYLGNLPVAEIGVPLALETLRRVEQRGTLETAAKCRRMGSQIFRYAIQTARATVDPFANLSGAIKSPPTKHRATVPLADMPSLFKALAEVPAELNTKLAFYWLLLTATRSSETRLATWGEIHGERWRVPAERMKMNREHVVPLSRQTLAVLKRARELRTGPEDTALLFPGFTRHGALSENALLALLARAGFYGRQTAHGFRASFSTWGHEEHEADPDVIEACLAHAIPGVRGDYNRATYVKQRLVLLQAWADQCEAWGMKLP